MTASPKLVKNIAIVLGVIIVVLLGVLFFGKPAKGPTVAVAQPAISSDGRVTVAMPLPNALVSSPIAITGEAKGGGWFFEASFPIKVLDADGTVLGQGPAQALSDWMTTGTVPFSASIVLTNAPKYATGTVILSKDNPSGEPANDLSLSIPVRFK